MSQSNGNGHRWSKFFWSDWENDDKLRLCSFAAQGVWMRALCLMHKSNGFLIVDGSAPNWRDLARIWGGKADQIERYFDELLARGVASRNETGVIFCRRMVNDIKASATGREHISKRWANREPNSPPNRSPNRDPNRLPITQNLEAEAEAENPPNPPTADAAGGLLGEVVPMDRRQRRREPAGGNAAAKLILQHGFETAQPATPGQRLNDAYSQFYRAPKGTA